ncbi:hypothetical protein GCM10011608_61520 [Micromonospora sonchi]|uniref:Peptide chain release factor H n=1 Tax=Micromonospora sonchi TaxID=1763543 RepID=A0A917X5P7_9ACTN|nr:peptide chain release factor-like protein [Micromonospora sonchi]GGM67978.1 hypothetical protein GCM10011608_61520 [Micromonospora sonchi]
MSAQLLLSAGRGPEECAWAVARLLRRLETDATRRRLTTHRVDTVPGDRPGTFRSAVVEIHGAGAEAFAATWTGTLCWQAPSPYRAGAGRKNWYVTARPCRLETAMTPFRESDVEIEACRTGSPGGQHRNKASTVRWRIHDQLVRGNPPGLNVPSPRRRVPGREAGRPPGRTG